MGITVRDPAGDGDPCLRLETVQHCATCKSRFLAVCSALDEQELVTFDRVVQHRCLPAKTLLFEEGQPTDFVYSLTEGMVRLFRLLPDGRRQIVGFALPGDFLSVSLPKAYEYSAETIGPVKICRIPRGAFADMVNDKPHLLKKLHAVSGEEISRAREHMVLLGRKNAEERIAAFLINMRERWAREHGLSVTVPLPMSRTDIADYLGLTIETVSRTISKLARNKTILVVPDGVRLVDLPKLAAASGD
jgi:CRP/FNR family transcriptional regulator